VRVGGVVRAQNLAEVVIKTFDSAVLLKPLEYLLVVELVELLGLIIIVTGGFCMKRVPDTRDASLDVLPSLPCFT